ncbi:MAG: trypsin-like peptidase domain-containing protein [Halobacteriovoraceae bacterium]|jgi:V8-like Glu-specific endopeptidase|nr:trypsin-like peptidase domain-containing protein [Halobacteriovoraceae bacterium]MBT5094922.1 trypsin-like peptidase domain-containing protein [Halobacteriovoraceae bacterium]
MNKVYLIGLVIFATSVCANETQVIYGEDDRVDSFELSDKKLADLAKSNVALIKTSKLTAGRTHTSIKGKTLIEKGVCKTERFAKQLAAARCSGFFIGDDLIVTAGHCMVSESDCANQSIVFGYQYDPKFPKTYRVKNSDVYTCSKILVQKYERSGLDYAVIKLDRKVKHYTPLEFRTSGKISKKEELTTIGHPSGLPQKIASGGSIRDNSKAGWFEANLDTFHGNSGSAVFNSQGVVEGILVRGEKDYVTDEKRGCRVVKVCKEGECRGEDVTRITSIPKLNDLL